MTMAQQTSNGLDAALAADAIAGDALATIPLNQRRYLRHVNTRGGAWLALAALRAWMRGDMQDSTLAGVFTLATGSIPSGHGFWAARKRRCTQRVADFCWRQQSRAVHAMRAALAPFLAHAQSPTREQWASAVTWAHEFACRLRDTHGHALPAKRGQARRACA